MSKILKTILKASVVRKAPFFGWYAEFLLSKNLPHSFWQYIKFRLGVNDTYWPKSKTCLVSHPRRIYVGECSKIGRPGSYLQGAGNIYIGKYVRMGPNCGIVSCNHDLYDRDKYVKKPIVISDYCWIGMNSFITAGVELGPFTVVGAGSVVTKSFPDGYCVIGGNPARVIKQLEREKCVPWTYDIECCGFVPKAEFEKNRRKYIDI